MTLLQTLSSAVSALAGGFAGGWLVAFRLGGWRQKVEDKLLGLEDRLARGDGAVNNVPVLGARVELILEELRTLRAEIRHERKLFVTHEECDRRHQDV